MLIGGFKIAMLPLCVIAGFAALLLVEEIMRRDRASAPDWHRISVNWGLGLTNWALAALVPASSLLAAVWAGVRAEPGLLTGWPAAAAFLPLLLVRSLAAYWLHRWMHRSRWLWRIHRVHHADTAIDCTTGLRNHPFEALVVTLPTVALVLALGPPLASVAAVEAVLLIANFWQHAAIALPAAPARRLEWLVITPRLHLLHHSQAKQDHDRNFGDLFSLWDRMFGTFAPPRAEAITVGLADEGQTAQSLPQQLAAPFRG